MAWLLGVKYNDCAYIGNLLGTRLILNEFVAFINLGTIKANIDPRSFIIATYALCGFANLSSVAIQVGGIGALAPTLLLYFLAAIPLFLLIDQVASPLGFYRLVWHPPLVRLALFACVFSGLVLFTAH